MRRSVTTASRKVDTARRQRAGRSVERGESAEGAALVGDGDEGGPLRGAGGGSADDLPAGDSLVSDRVIDGEAGRGVGVVGDIWIRAPAGGLSGFLIGRFVFVTA